ncbi:TetR/AcrR family transcriptional regulator [Hymenobacter ruber]
MLISSTALAEPPGALDRSHAVAIAQTLYFQAGIAAVSMADVAARLDLPESVVLAEFPAGKEALVQAVLKSYGEQMRAELEQLRRQCSTAVEELLAVRVLVNQKMAQGNTAFFRDAEVLYPAVWQQWQAQRNAHMFAYVRANLCQGIAQQLYQEGLDVDFLARLWQQQMRNLRTADAEFLSPAQMHHTLVAHFLAGIVTPAGAYVTRRLQEAEPFY